MAFKLEIDVENAAFGEDPSQELARLLESVANQIRNGRAAGRIHDINGNDVGSYEVEEA